MYSLEIKEQTLVLLKEYSVKEVATKTGISISTLYNWKKEYEKTISKSIRQMIADSEYEKGIETAELFLKYEPDSEVIQSQLITIYIKQGKYEKGIEIATRFPKDEAIQSQLITMYIKQGKYEKGIETAELFLKYEPDSEVIQSQLITMYIKQGKYEKGIEIAKCFPKNEAIQSQLITIYIKQGKYEEGIEIAKRFPNYESIQSQLITIYIKQGKYEKGIEIATRFPKDEAIQSQLITMYIKQGKYEKGIETAELFLKYEPDSEVIQSQLITMYIKQGKYEKGIEIAKCFPKNEAIQSQLITIYIKQGKYEKGIEIAKCFPKNVAIQSQLITIYIKQGKYEKGIEIAELFLKYNPDSEVIQGQLNYIYKNYKNRKVLKNNLNINPIEDEIILKKINQIRSKILLGTVQLEDVQYLDSFKDEIGLERYLLIKAAIYERLNFKNNCVAIIRQIPNMDIRQKRKLIEEVLKKQKYYNIQKWDELIKWEIDDMESYLENKNQIVEIEQKRLRKPILSVEKSTKKQNNSEKTKIVSGTMTKNNIKNNKNIKIKKEQKTTIYEILNKEYKLAVYELKLKYYLEMYDEHHKKDGILKYDRLETVLNSDSSNTLAFKQLLLMLMDVQYDFSDDYPKEYEEINQKIKVLNKKG